MTDVLAGGFLFFGQKTHDLLVHIIVAMPITDWLSIRDFDFSHPVAKEHRTVCISAPKM